ncbi:MAG TPA: hypothetical protein VGL23_17045, partial [Chloroflexota bacterium]
MEDLLRDYYRRFRALPETVRLLAIVTCLGLWCLYMLGLISLLAAPRLRQAPVAYAEAVGVTATFTPTEIPLAGAVQVLSGPGALSETPLPSATPTNTETPAPRRSSTATPTATLEATPTQEIPPTYTPTVSPSPTRKPTATPTSRPSAIPTSKPKAT